MCSFALKRHDEARALRDRGVDVKSSASRLAGAAEAHGRFS
jgi:hypothetical protein